MTRAIRIHEHGGPDVLRWDEVDPGTPGAGQALIRQTAAGLNFIDVYHRTGLYPVPAMPAIIGSEGAGVVEAVGAEIGLHLHDTRGTALVCAFTALQLGVGRFDTSVGGLGCSPFATGATGNLATEELVAMLVDLGVATGIDVEGMVRAAAVASELVGRPVPSRVATAGPRTRRSGAD